MIRVAVADDQAVVRMGLRVVIERESDMAVVAEAGDGQAVLDLVHDIGVDILLLDIRMPGRDGLDVLATIASSGELSGIRVIVVTTFEIDEYVFRALESGASGFLVKDTPPEDIVRAIRVVAAGEALLSPSVTRRVVDRFGRGPATGAAPVPGVAELTDREREITAWVATGRSNEEIAEQLVISPDTVRTHVSRAMVKLVARDRAQLVVLAVRAGISPPG
ncbi:response regulator transcription factor [Saccharopolyspora sp. HNM0983]|uniref:Response regulator transcription factor n=1 Tax=Saccharopolyspora montiporae TaxID=2781240 RepID=A0A929BF80_9PSEU|nr:response regulator transcription factor [Saccharopolyspora sp. HNM0983]MBE9376473.1 response regulator transcription factor [Saccharopolyspora sp. HNM0983]